MASLKIVNRKKLISSKLNILLPPMSAQRYFIRISFHGKNYHGWQVQANAHTVQAELESALSTLAKEKVETVGCGRTDTGVHAREFYAHFELRQKVEDEEVFCHHLNGIIPADIAIQKLIPVASDAHSRFDATSRTYEYHIYRYKNPFLKEFACYLPNDLDYKCMNKFARLLKEVEDFSSFSKNNTQVLTNKCCIMHAEWKVNDDKAVFVIKANRFLRNMVRAIVGTLLRAGEHKLSEDDFLKILGGKDRKLAGASMPACGLYLVKVEYPYLSA